VLAVKGIGPAWLAKVRANVVIGQGTPAPAAPAGATAGAGSTAARR
jgi:competence protein ComEA